MNYKEYHPDWRDIIRPDILRRDNYKCTVCGIRHKSYIMYIQPRGWQYIEVSEYEEYKRVGVKVARVILQVAHMDNNKSNNSYDNLKSHCLSCHNNRDKEHKKLMRLANRAEKETTRERFQLSLFDDNIPVKDLIQPTAQAITRTT